MSGQSYSGFPAVLSSILSQFTGCSSGSPFLTWNGTCSASSAATQRGLNAVTDGGMSTSLTDNSSAFLSMLSTNCASTACEIYIPCGVYKFTASGQIPVTSSTYQNVKLLGEGRGNGWGHFCVEFEAMSANVWPVWFDNTTTNNGNNGGPDIENISFVDGNGNAAGGLRLTQMNNVQLGSLGFYNFTGTNYSAGNVTVTNGQQAFSCASCTLTSQMVYGRIGVNGQYAEIASVTSSTTGTLTSNWSYPSQTNYSNWNVMYNGVGLMLEGSSVATAAFAQYGLTTNIWALNNLVAVDAVGGTTSSFGTSRFRFIGGYVSCNRLPDSMAFFFGKYSDTMTWDVSSNNCAFHGLIENGQIHRIESEMENTGAYTVVTTCNGGVAAKSCTKGVELTSEASGRTHDNVFALGYIANTGNALEFNNINAIGSGTKITSIRLISGSSTNNYCFTATTACDTSVTAQGIATILDSDATVVQASSLTVNGLLWQTGSGTPSGSCVTGSMYSNSSGASGTTFYACVGAAWVDIK